MNESYEKLRDLFNRIPRRHTADNVKEIYSILDAYEDVLKEMEADSDYQQQKVAPLFEALLNPLRGVAVPDVLEDQAGIAGAVVSLDRHPHRRILGIDDHKHARLREHPHCWGSGDFLQTDTRREPLGKILQDLEKG